MNAGRVETNELLMQRVGVLEEAIKRNAPEYAVERRYGRLERWIMLRVAKSGMPDDERGRFSQALRQYLASEVLRSWDGWRTPGASSGLTLSEIVYGLPNGDLGFRAARAYYDGQHVELNQAIEARHRNETKPVHVEHTYFQSSPMRVSAAAVLAILFGIMLFPIDGGKFHDNYRSVIFSASLSAIFGYAFGTRVRK